MGDWNTADRRVEGVELPKEPGGPSESSTPFLGELNNRFRVRRLLGSGGMSIVLEAHDDTLDRDVAIKLVRCGPGAEARARRLLREARTVARLKSPHVVRVLDWGWLDQHSPFIVMELLNGRDLGTVLRAEGPMPLGRALRCMVSACDALIEAHAAGIIHRDLKPSNLFVVPEPDGGELVKVLDFGLVKELHAHAASTNLTRGANLLGTPRYMAPEQLTRNAKLDERVDVWAAAITLHELVTGRMPFQAGSRADLLHAILSEPARPLGADLERAPAALESLLLRSLEKAPENRVPNLSHFRRELQQLLGSVSAAELGVDPPKTRARREDSESSSTYTATSGVQRSPHGVELQRARVSAASLSLSSRVSRGLLAAFAVVLLPASLPISTDVPPPAAPERRSASLALSVTQEPTIADEPSHTRAAIALTALPEPRPAAGMERRAPRRPVRKAAIARQEPAPLPSVRASADPNPEPPVVDLQRAISTRK